MTTAWAVALAHADKLVLLALADNANDEGLCYPSVTTLAEKCCMHRSTVLRSLQSLEEAGQVTRDLRSGRATVYHVHPSQIATGRRLQPVAERDPSQAATGSAARPHPSQSATPPVADCDPSAPRSPPQTPPLTPHYPEPSLNRQGNRSARAREAERVFDHWRETWGHPRALLDAKRRKRIEARLTDFSADQLCDAISGFRHSPWHCGTDPKGEGVVYDAIDTLLRDTAQVEKGLRLFAHPPRPPPKPETVAERMRRLNSGDEDDGRTIDVEPEGASGNDLDAPLRLVRF